MSHSKTKEEEVQTTLNTRATHAPSDPEQILHLKRLLVTLKHQYEKGLQQLNEQLQKEQARSQSITKKVELAEEQQANLKKYHEEELHSLRNQIIHLRDSSKMSEVEETVFSPELEASQQRIEQLERVIPYLRERANEANLETEQLREELNETRRANEELKKRLLEFQSEEKNFSHQSQALETRYVEILNQKIVLEHQLGHSKENIEQQTNLVASLQNRNQLLEQEKSQYEEIVREKNRLLEQEKAQFEEIIQEKNRLVEQEKNQCEAIIQEKNRLIEQEKRQYEEIIQEKNQFLEQEKRHCDERISQIHAQLEQLLGEQASLHTYAKEMEQQRQTYENSFQDKCVQYEGLINEKTYLQQHVNHLQSEIINLQHQLGQITILQNQIQKLEQENQILEVEKRDWNIELKEILKEKTNLEHEIPNLHIHIDHQSAYIVELKSKLQLLEQQKKKQESLVVEGEQKIEIKQKQNEDLQLQLEQFEQLQQETQALFIILEQEKLEHIQKLELEKSSIQEQFVSLQEVCKQLTQQLEKSQEAHIKIENQLNEVESAFKVQVSILNEKNEQCSHLQQEKEAIDSQLHSLRIQSEESESRLKVAQLHLAKKVKEATLLNEKIEQMQYCNDEYFRTLEAFKAQVIQLQTGIEKHQSQENRLQEQLKEAVKNADVQISKWEEKYFRVYDKWQENEIKVRELKKVEEKHYQMQKLLSNLGSYIEGGDPSPTPGFSFTNLVLSQKNVVEPIAKDPEPTFTPEPEPSFSFANLVVAQKNEFEPVAREPLYKESLSKEADPIIEKDREPNFSFTSLLASQNDENESDEERSNRPTFFNSNDGGAFLEEHSDYSNGHFDLFGMHINKKNTS
jgi:predicted  nucleic acid-binding Zn-ribbon protein